MVQILRQHQQRSILQDRKWLRMVLVIDAWFSKVVGLTCRLVHMPDESLRPVNTTSGVRPEGKFTSFSDAYPFLLLSEESMEDLNNRSGNSFSIKRFRPNIVTKGGVPYHEDHLTEFRIGEVQFLGIEKCARCAVPNVDVTVSTPQTGYEWAEIVGNRIASTIENTLGNASLPIIPKLKCASKKIDLTLQEFANEDVEVQRKIWHSPKRSSLNFLEVVHAGKVANIYDRHNGGPVSVLIQAVQLAENTVIVGLPSEISVVLGLALKQNSPYENTFTLQLSNDWLGYIPHQKIFEEGHYEAVVAKIKPGQGEYLINQTVEMLNQLKSSP